MVSYARGVQIVLYRLTDRHVLAELLAINGERADLRTYVIYPDGHLDTLEISGATQGPGINQWQNPLDVTNPVLLVEEPHLPIPMPAQ